MANKSFVDVGEAYTYSELPFFRKRWFIVLTLLLFAPATVIIAGTGDIYALRDGRVSMYSPSAKKSLIIVACILIAMGFWRLLKPN